MRRGLRTALLVAGLTACSFGCRGKTEAENAELRAKVEELTRRAAQLEADNDRLRTQVDLLTRTTESLTQALKAQNALGRIPERPAPSPSPSR